MTVWGKIRILGTARVFLVHKVRTKKYDYPVGCAGLVRSSGYKISNVRGDQNTTKSSEGNVDGPLLRTEIHYFIKLRAGLR